MLGFVFKHFEIDGGLIILALTADDTTFAPPGAGQNIIEILECPDDKGFGLGRIDKTYLESGRLVLQGTVAADVCDDLPARHARDVDALLSRRRRQGQHARPATPAHRRKWGEKFLPHHNPVRAPWVAAPPRCAWAFNPDSGFQLHGHG